MSNSFEKESDGRAQVTKGGAFEHTVQTALEHVFGRVEAHKRIEGFSGVAWRVDFLVDSSLVVEASVQRRLETKIDSTFLKFTDLTRKHGDFKAALVVEELQVGLHKTLQKKFFPTSEYRTLTSFGFPILRLAELDKLADFKKGLVSARDVSSKPVGFKARSIFSNTKETSLKILEILAKGPAPRREISRAVGQSPYVVDNAIRLLPQVKKVSSYYGLSTEDIYRRLIRKKNKSATQEKLTKLWLRERFLEQTRSKGESRTSVFAAKYGLGQGSLAHLVHQLNREGKLRKKRRGIWTLSNDPAQTSLDHEETQVSN